VPWAAPIISLGTLVYAIISARSKATAERVADVEERVDKLEDRTTTIETDFRHLPDKDSTNRLEVGLAELKADVRVVAEGLKPVAAISNRLQEFLLEQARQK
jgi:hypothetical protein